ncbi:myo-inositol-1-phosphate synthase [Sphingomonas sanguinis]|uniref:Myo-inositol-1-phosphate synthase n=1 Tax=Sphingomonas sanguinis TaxID=33051 RepID=A0A147IMI2_9SPHN|nr:myo-inositol-1-phosphate synthase [Sphingomonas sanguinis]KTT96477.1 myo-inositol-1-phosphate synthase [Sphingomonas sanguinis]
MSEKKLKLAVAGVGNNITALMQGVSFYKDQRTADCLVGIKNPFIGSLHVSDIDFVAAFDIDDKKIGASLDQAIFAGTNNYPMLDVHLDQSPCRVVKGIRMSGNCLSNMEQVVDTLRESGAEVLLYSLPTGLQWAADAYAAAALEAGVAFVNCTPEVVSRNADTLGKFKEAGIPLLGDDLASHLGSSVVHRVLLRLLAERGITLTSSYQLNLGGNADFANLRVAGASKHQSKLNALAQDGVDTSAVEVIPSAGFLKQLNDNKVGYFNIEGAGWAGTPVSLDLKLKVQDSSNAAGVIIDLIRVAAISLRLGKGGFNPAAVPCLKSPPGGHPHFSDDEIANSLAELSAA